MYILVMHSIITIHVWPCALHCFHTSILHAPVQNDLLDKNAGTKFKLTEDCLETKFIVSIRTSLYLFPVISEVSLHLNSQPSRFFTFFLVSVTFEFFVLELSVFNNNCLQLKFCLSRERRENQE